MSMTGMWFQMARGRAMVRRNSMKTARRLKAQGREYAYYVERARKANHDWQTYRRLHLQFERD